MPKAKASKTDRALDQMCVDAVAENYRVQLLEELSGAGYAIPDTGADDGVYFADIQAAVTYLDAKKLLLEGEMASLLAFRQHLTTLQKERDALSNTHEGVFNVPGIGPLKFRIVDISTTPFAQKAAKKTKTAKNKA